MTDPNTPVVLRFADVLVSTLTMRVTRGGERVTLEPRAFDLLVYLAERPGQLVAKETLVRDVWHGTAVSDNAITRVVAQLRRALGDTAHEPRFIETVPTRGYRFIADVVRESVPPDEPAAPSAVASPTFTGRGRVLTAPRIAALAGAVAAGMTAVWMTVRATSPPPGPPASDLTFSAAVPRQLTVSSGLDLFPAVSPDGTAVAYASDRSGRFEIVIRALSPGGGERFLTTDGLQNVQPAWSPDGRFIAFHSRTSGGIWLVSSQGGVPRQVADAGSAPAWSPDGAWLAYQSAALTDLGPSAGAAMPPSTIRIVSASGGDSRPLTRPGAPDGGHGRPFWSRDGRHVVFGNGGPMSQDVWAVPAEGGDPWRLLACEPSCLDPFFGPDGLYYTEAHVSRLWRVELDASGLRARGIAKAVEVPVSGTVRGVSLSANGRIAAFASVEIRSNLVSVGLDDRGNPAREPRSVTNDRSRRNTMPSVSPDGQRIAYVAGRGGSTHDIWMVNLDGSQAEQITVERDAEQAPTWSADGRAIRFKVRRDDAVVLREVDVRTRRDRDVLLLDGSTIGAAGRADGLRTFTLRATRDVSRVTFAGLAGGVPNIFAGKVPLVSVGQVTRDPQGASFPVLSPAADLIAVQLYRGDNTHLGVVADSGGPVTQLTTARGQTWSHDWSPDGARVAAAVMREGIWNVATISRRSGEERILTSDRTARTYVRYPAWSPLGDFIVFERAEITGNIWTSELK